jgi:amphi-Trp domain-containing protein
MKHRKARDIEKTYTPAQFAAKLRRLADAVELGQTFTIEVAGERLRIPVGAKFNVEHEREGSVEELEFQLTWKTASKPKPG